MEKADFTCFSLKCLSDCTRFGFGWWIQRVNLSMILRAFLVLLLTLKLRQVRPVWKYIVAKGTLVILMVIALEIRVFVSRARACAVRIDLVTTASMMCSRLLRLLLMWTHKLVEVVV